MAKTALYYEEAKRLYVVEGFSIDAIAAILKGKVSRRTLYNWRRQGAWDEKRKAHLEQTEDIQEQLKKLAQITLREALKNPTPHNIYAVVKAISALRQFQGVKVLEEETSENERKDITENLKEIIRAIAGEEIR